MNILVCVSRVPDTAARINIGGNGKSIESAGVKFIVNPYDEFALETGMRLKEAHGGTVTAVTVGESNDVLRTALAMGVDTAIHVKADINDIDSFGVAENLAAVAKEINADLVVLGRQSIDYDSYGMASTLGALLDQPSVSVVSKIDVNGSELTCERDIEGGKETITVSTPCVISTQKGIYEPRYPKLPQIMKAKKKPIDEKDNVASSKRTEVLSMEIPQSSRVGKIVGDSDNEIAEIVKALREDAKVI